MLENIKVWIIENKKWIISELKGIISDVEDEHQSTPAFFKSIKNKIDKWEETWKMESEKRGNTNETDLKYQSERFLGEQAFRKRFFKRIGG